jgi:hypothetical protein
MIVSADSEKLKTAVCFSTLPEPFQDEFIRASQALLERAQERNSTIVTQYRTRAMIELCDSSKPFFSVAHVTDPITDEPTHFMLHPMNASALIDELLATAEARRLYGPLPSTPSL